MMIDINTDQLQSLVQVARAANMAITDAAQLLNTVVAHNDWQCPERTEINNGLISNRTQSLALQTDAERLYTNSCYAAEQFLAAEQEILAKFDTVDGPIASFLALAPEGSELHTHAATLPTSAGMSAAEAVIQATGGGVAKAMKETAKVISFEGILDAFKGK